MDRNRTVAGLDVHKDSIYLCIMGHDGSIIFEKTSSDSVSEFFEFFLFCIDMLLKNCNFAFIKILYS